MNWPWRMPREYPWVTPYPLPRDTSQALLAQGQCENFGLLQERYLAFGSNRGKLEIVREMIDRCSGGVREIHISGGMPPEWTFDHYVEIVRALHQAYGLES